MSRRTILGAALIVLATACVPRHADRLFLAQDYPSAIAAYEAYLVRRGEFSADDAPILLRLALAYDRAEEPQRDLETSRYYLQLLSRQFPDTQEGIAAQMLLDGARARVEASRLAVQIRQRDERLAALQRVLDLVAEEKRELSDEVAGREREQQDLEGRVRELTRQARVLSSEIAELEGELEALKQIDLESVAGEPPP